MGKQVDKNDFWFIEKNPITKVGVYPYLGKQISQDCEPDKIYYVLRPKEELFRKETLDSLRLIPLIDGHTMIGKDFTAPEDKGLDGTLGDNVSHDTDTIYNDLKIISNKMKEEIQNGKKELSLGYFCRYDKQPGTYKGQRYDYVQRDIIANHLALVDKGRMGADVRVYDSKNIPEGEAFAMDSIDIAIDKDEDIEWITVRGTHVPIKKGESKEQAVKKFLEERNINNKIFQKHEENKRRIKEIQENKEATDSMEYKTIQGEGKMEKEKKVAVADEDKRKLIDEIGGILKDKGLDDEIIRTVIGKAEKIAYNKSEAGDEEEEVIEEEKDKKPAKDKCGKDEEGKKEENKKEEKKGMDEGEIFKMLARKEKLAKEVETVIGTFDHSEMTENQVAKYACDKLELGAVEGQELATLKGYLKAVASSPKVTYGYKTVAADGGIQKEDAEFEKFSKGE